MTVYEINYRTRLTQMLDTLITNLGFEDSRVIFFATLVEKYYNEANYNNRELLESYFKKYSKAY